MDTVLSAFQTLSPDLYIYVFLSLHEAHHIVYHHSCVKKPPVYLVFDLATKSNDTNDKRHGQLPLTFYFSLNHAI